MLFDARFEVGPGVAHHPLDRRGEVAGYGLRRVVTEDGEVELVGSLRPVAPGDLEAEAGVLRDGVRAMRVTREAVDQGEGVRDDLDGRRLGVAGRGEGIVRSVLEDDPGFAVHGSEPSSV